MGDVAHSEWAQPKNSDHSVRPPVPTFVGCPAPSPTRPNDRRTVNPAGGMARLSVEHRLASAAKLVCRRLGNVSLQGSSEGTLIGRIPRIWPNHIEFGEFRPPCVGLVPSPPGGLGEDLPRN